MMFDDSIKYIEYLEDTEVEEKEVEEEVTFKVLDNFYNIVEDKTFKKSGIVSQTEDTFVYKEVYESCWPLKGSAFFEKKPVTVTKKAEYKTYKFNRKKEYWVYESEEQKVEDTFVLSLEEIFDEFNSEFCLLESKEELLDYLNSKFDLPTWGRLKVVRKMKELGLGMGFITHFAELIGTDLDKYRAMVDLAEEIEDKDLLMYLYVNKFGKK